MPYYIQRLYRLCNASFSPNGLVSEEVIEKVREKLGIFSFRLICLAFIFIFMATSRMLHAIQKKVVLDC